VGLRLKVAVEELYITLWRENRIYQKTVWFQNRAGAKRWFNLNFLIALYRLSQLNYLPGASSFCQAGIVDAILAPAGIE
jgi:hypothetical protein